jgi:Tfp pilus assembly protein PilN
LNLLRERGSDSQARWKRVARLAAPAAVVAVALLTWFAVSWCGARSRARQAQAKLSALAPQTKRAAAVRRLYRAAGPWHRANPGFLDALRALTRRFPEEGVIWLTNLELSESGEMTLSGRARRRGNALALLNALEADDRFAKVTSHYLRQQTGAEQIVTFSMSCRYRGGDRP